MSHEIVEKMISLGEALESVISPENAAILVETLLLAFDACDSPGLAEELLLVMARLAKIAEEYNPGLPVIVSEAAKKQGYDIL